MLFLLSQEWAAVLDPETSSLPLYFRSHQLSGRGREQGEENSLSFAL